MGRGDGKELRAPSAQLLLCGAGGGVGVLMDLRSQLSHLFKGS